MNKSTSIILGIVALVIIFAALAMSGKDDFKDSAALGKGSVYVGVTDATAEIANVNEIELSIDKVEVYNAESGWTTLSADSKTYPLLALKQSNTAKLYVERNDVPATTYDRVRVTLGDATIKTKTSGEVMAVMPTRTMVINTDVNVKANESAYLLLDFKADKSLHVAKDGKYVFAAVVEEEAKSGVTVSVSADGVVSSTGGTTESNTSVGVDLDGSIKSNFELKTDNTLEIKSSSPSGTTFLLNGKEIKINASADDDEDGSVLDVKAGSEVEGTLKNDMIDTRIDGVTDIKTNL